MRNNRACSDDSCSELVRRFVERSGLEITLHPEQVMAALVERLHQRFRDKRQGRSTEWYLRDRNIRRVEVVPDLNCDGFIEPLGSKYGEGFRVVVKKSPTSPRMRFTIAHEICHTFFYEFVPEIKFGLHDPSQPDPMEERLCNFGAAGLLIPPRRLKRYAKSLPVCLESLDALSSAFCVSVRTMALRLTSLGLWQCELSFWHRMVNGDFALERIYGGKPLPWQWSDESTLESAFESSEPVYGEGFISYADQLSTRRYRPISYQVRRTPGGVMILWGRRIRKPKTGALPLFDTYLPTVARSSSVTCAGFV